MAMLAEPRRKQRWSINPRGSLWANDNQKFGQKLMEKMGWSKGKGLGREEQGQTEHISVRCKEGNKGLGFKGKDDEWIKHYEGFENVLAMLNSEHNSAANSKTNSTSNSSAISDEETEQKDLKSLEARSKVSRARVHYHKFTRGKDLSRYNDDDIACILGSKRAKILAEAEAVVESTSKMDEIGHVDKLNGVTTIKGCNVQDYFAKKMAALKRKTIANTLDMETNNYTEEEEDFEGRAEYGFDRHTENEEVTPHIPVNYIEGNAEGTENVIGRGTQEEEENKENPKKKKKNREKQDGLEHNVGTEETFEKNEELQESIEGKKKKRKKNKKGKGENNESCECLDPPAEVRTEKKSKKKRKKNFIEEEFAVDYSKLVETEEIHNLHLKKKKKKRDAALADNIVAFNEEESVLECVEESSNPDKVKKKRKKKHSECGNNDSADLSKLRNKKHKRKGSSMQENVNGETCHGDIDKLHSDMQYTKKKKKKGRKQMNEEE